MEFSEFGWVVLLRLVLASLCGGLIGVERGMKGQAAGSRTFSLVCMGAALAMLTNGYIFKHLAGGAGDVTRMAAQVISGIGFLGAGTIMMTSHNHVKGLTTAAALWVTAAVGNAIGCGFYLGGLAGMAAVVLSSGVLPPSLSASRPSAATDTVGARARSSATFPMAARTVPRPCSIPLASPAMKSGIQDS